MTTNSGVHLVNPSDARDALVHDCELNHVPYGITSSGRFVVLRWPVKLPGEMKQSIMERSREINGS